MIGQFYYNVEYSGKLLLLRLMEIKYVFRICKIRQMRIKIFFGSLLLTGTFKKLKLSSLFLHQAWCFLKMIIIVYINGVFGRHISKIILQTIILKHHIFSACCHIARQIFESRCKWKNYWRGKNLNSLQRKKSPSKPYERGLRDA